MARFSGRQAHPSAVAEQATAHHLRCLRPFFPLLRSPPLQHQRRLRLLHRPLSIQGRLLQPLQHLPTDASVFLPTAARSSFSPGSIYALRVGRIALAWTQRAILVSGRTLIRSGPQEQVGVAPTLTPSSKTTVLSLFGIIPIDFSGRRIPRLLALRTKDQLSKCMTMGLPPLHLRPDFTFGPLQQRQMN